MSKTYSNNSIETKASPSIALPNSVIGYGNAIGTEQTANNEAVNKESIGELISFYYGEYITGILFIVALTLYTVLMPAVVRNPLKNVYGMLDRFLKKVLDVGGAILGLILALPFFIVIPILIKLTSRGSVFYTQERIGVNRRRLNRRIYEAEVDGNHRIRERRREDNLGRPFKVIKFRTMVNNAEAKTGAVWAKKNDSRITFLGRILRKSRIDELPQLINVLKGEMSLVGPRPERPVFVRNLSTKVPDYSSRLIIKPGITGLAQVSSGYDDSLESVVDKVNFDIKYIRNWSIFSDLRILCKTVTVVLTGRGAC